MEFLNRRPLSPSPACGKGEYAAARRPAGIPGPASSTRGPGQSAAPSAASPAILAVALAIALAPAVAAGAEGEAAEAAIKATYLYKFADYVDWPAKAFPSPQAPVNLCIAGDDPFGAALDSAVSGQRIGGREVVVRRLKSVGRDSGCHILFVGGADNARSAQALAAVRGSPTLTVTDSREGGGAAGMINFVVKDNRVRFEIAPETAADSGVALSSKLLALAVNLRSRSTPESH